MSNKKTNIDWLRQIIEKSEKTIDPDEYKEAIEFLDAVQEDFDNLKKEGDDKGDKIKSLEIEIGDKQVEINDFEPDWTTIRAGIGTIDWKSDNIQLQYIMEAVEEKLKTTSPNDIVTILTA